MNNDQIALLFVAAAAAVLAYLRRGQIAASLSGWLQRSGVLTEPGAGLVQIPHLGGLDGPRLLIVGGVLVALVVTVRVIRRARRARLQQQP